MKLRSMILGAVAALTTTTAVFAQEATTAPAATPAADENQLMIAGVRIGNPFDAATWWEGQTEAAKPVAINPMDPTFWTGMMDPAQQNDYLFTFTDPATMGEFMKLETYVAMMDTNVWVKWIDLESYAPMVDLNTYAYWMQPGAYMPYAETEPYMQMAEVSAYMDVLNAGLGMMGLSTN